MTDVKIQNGSTPEDWTPPNLPSKCTYHLGQPLVQSPHNHKKSVKIPDRPKILPNILGAIGQTPMVRINRIGKELGLECEIVAKCEFFNAAGSTKDRIALRMIEDAEDAGIIKPGVTTLIEPSSGNTGVGFGMVTAVKGYRSIIVMPEKNSMEKVAVMRALGSELIRTPTAATYDSPESAFRVAYTLRNELENAVVLDQYRCAGNALAHYDWTAEEILDACDDKLDMMVLGCGTGGTLTGVARKIKERCPNCILVAVDPVGSAIAQPESLNIKGSALVEGIGKDFVPTVCDRKLVDKWYKCFDKESFNMARRLIKDEGMLCGGSCGAAMYCALQAIQDFNMGGADKRVCVLLPDSIRNYMSKHLSDEWMEENNFLEENEENVPEWSKYPVSRLDLTPPEVILDSMKVGEAINKLKSQSADQGEAVCVSETGVVGGMVTLARLSKQVMKENCTLKDPVSKVMYTRFQTLPPEATLRQLSKCLDMDYFVVIVRNGSTNAELNQSNILGMATAVDLITFTSKTNGSTGSGSEPDN